MTIGPDSPSPFDRDRIAGHWVHSHEEDSPGRQVFRRAGRVFPPARGRRELTLEGDGRIVEQRPGADDRRQTGTGTWTLDGDVVRLSWPGRPSEVMKVLSVAADSLVIAHP